MMKDQGRMRAASQVVAAIFEHRQRDPELIIQAIELLDDCGRKQAAANLSEACIDEGSLDPRLHAYSAMLLAQLGEFERSRVRYEFVASHSSLAPEWHVPQGLAGLQKYQSIAHPDFALFQRYLQQSLSDPAKTSLLYALGKAHDDLGDTAQAVGYFREANALEHARSRWSRKRWSRSVEVRKQRQRPPVSLPEAMDWTPVFVVGAPRSGSSLLAQQLARYPQVSHRGELPWLPRLVAALDPDGPDYPQQLRQVAAAYAAQLRQDDSDARWFIDKQPHNYMEIDIILAMFPQAQIIHCERNARDCGLSIWMQAFQTGQQDFASDFTDIAGMIRDERQLMAYWQTRYGDAIRSVRYEELTSDPAEVIQGLCDWLGVPAAALQEPRRNADAIATASLWQARQPIHTRSVARWKRYAQYLPELLQLPDD
jgi:tetratricopeptide (TPR) repeat protein